MPLTQSFDYSATPPGQASPPGLAWWPACRVAAAGNVASLAAPGLVNGAVLRLGERVLLPRQTSAVQNGIYVVDVPGAEQVPTSQAFADEQTPLTVTGLTAGRLYSWVRGAHTARLVNGSQTLDSGVEETFIAAGTSVDLYGLSADDVLDSIRACGLSRASDAPTSTFVAGRGVFVESGLADTGLWRFTGGAYVWAFGAANPTGSTGVGALTATAPTTPAHGVGAMTTGGPGEYILPGAPAPVNTATPVAPPTVVAHSTALQAGVNYLVQVGSRSAPVTVTLPAAPASGQRIEVVDTSGQGALHPITVDAGAVDIETAGTKTYLVNRNDAVLALYYTGAKWKLL